MESAEVYLVFSHLWGVLDSKACVLYLILGELKGVHSQLRTRIDKNLYEQNPLNPYERRGEIVQVASSIQCCFLAFSAHPDLLNCSIAGKDSHNISPPSF